MSDLERLSTDITERKITTVAELAKEVEKLKNQGKNPEQIAKILGVDKVKIQRHFYRLKKSGETPPRISFDNLESATDFWINVLQEYKKVSILEHDNKLLIKENERLSNELSACRTKLKVLTEKKEAYLLAIKNGSVKEPVS